MYVVENTIGSERVTQTLTGVEYTVGLMVYDVPVMQPYLKTQYVLDNIGYAYGAPYPGNELAKLSRIDARAVAHDTYEVELTYTYYKDGYQVSISSQVYQTETNKDDSDNLVTVSYKYPDDYELDTSLQGKVISKSPTISKDAHDIIVTITREETTSHIDIIEQADSYVNTLNNSGWTFHPSAYQGSYKCLAINGEMNESGTFTKNYIFAYRRPIYAGDLVFASGFDVDMYYRDERTGEPPADVVAYSSIVGGVPDPSPGGLKTAVSIYKKKDFNALISV